MVNSNSARIAFIFVDGIGIGNAGPDNPFSVGSYPALERLARSKLDNEHFVPYGAELENPEFSISNPASASIAHGSSESASHVVGLLDATLGVEGLPQSGTGQATLFTGVNCARLAGRHFGPFPHSKTRQTIRDSNIFTRLQRTGIASSEMAFANAFPERFFEYARTRDRWTVTTRSCLDGGVAIRTIEQLREGMALPADLCGERLRELGIPFDPISPEEAAQSLRNILKQGRFALFEYFLTDKAGHKMDRVFAREALGRLDRFVSELLRILNFETDLLVLTSDHGNLEDLSTRSHTINPVPFLAYGRGAQHFSNASTLADVVAPCVNLLSESAS